jgi:SAM-dependent methyltransferase
MLDFKKRGAFIRLGWQAALGKRVPDHGYRPLRISMTRRLAEAVIVAIFAVCGTQPARRMAEWIPARLMGPLFDGLRKAWKRVSKPTKRRGLQDLVFEITTGDGAAPRARQITHESLWRRAAREIGYWRRATWTLEEVAEHWDRTDAYDEINAATYAYARRFADALRLSAMPDRAHTLDLCARTGLGTLYFHQRGKIGAAVCADVSLTMGEICRRRLRDHGVDPLTWVRIDGEVLPFENATFDAVLCFESVEHFPRPAVLLAELGRVTRPGGTLLLTTPNVLWEPAHALAAITGIHHSEGPHRFIRYRRLIAMLARAGFRVTRAETTVLIPAGPRWLLRFGEWLEEKTRYSLLPLAGLRRIIVCSKQ